MKYAFFAVLAVAVGCGEAGSAGPPGPAGPPGASTTAHAAQTKRSVVTSVLLIGRHHRTNATSSMTSPKFEKKRAPIRTG